MICLVNPLVDLILFPYLRDEYNLIEDITLKIATKTLVLFLFFLSTLYSLYIYQRDKDVVKMNNSYIASNEYNCKFLVSGRERKRKRESVLLIDSQINTAASY